MAEKEKAQFEEALARLEQMVEELESGRLTLDESLARYEEGVKALRRCYEVLRDAETRVELLIRNSNGSLGAVPFESEDPEEGEDAADEEEDSDGDANENG